MTLVLCNEDHQMLLTQKLWWRAKQSPPWTGPALLKGYLYVEWDSIWQLLGPHHKLVAICYWDRSLSHPALPPATMQHHAAPEEHYPECRVLLAFGGVWTLRAATSLTDSATRGVLCVCLSRPVKKNMPWQMWQLDNFQIKAKSRLSVLRSPNQVCLTIRFLQIVRVIADHTDFT